MERAHLEVQAVPPRHAADSMGAEMKCACGMPVTELCPFGFTGHVHCFLCGICTRTSDGERRSCGGTAKNVKAARRARFSDWAKENLR